MGWGSWAFGEGQRARDAEMPHLPPLHDTLPDWFAQELHEAQVKKARRTPKFNILVFVLIWAEHFFYPLSAIIVIPTLGCTPLINQLFLPVPPLSALARYYSAVFNVATPLLLWCAHGALFLSSRPNYTFLWPIVALADVLHGMRYTVIAIKYAYMTKAERRIILHGSFKDSMKLNTSMQVHGHACMQCTYALRTAGGSSCPHRCTGQMHACTSAHPR